MRRLPTGYRILGREKDIFARADSGLVTSHEIDEAWPAGFACWHWSLTQTSDHRWEFHYVADAVAPVGLDAALAEVLGPGARVALFRRKSIQPAASGKFALLKPLAR